MDDLGLITEILIPLLSDKRVPLRAIALTGEIITADARFKDRGQGKTVRADLDAIIEVLDIYEGLQEEVSVAVSDFNEKGFENVLIDRLTNIGRRLKDLY